MCRGSGSCWRPLNLECCYEYFPRSVWGGGEDGVESCWAVPVEGCCVSDAEALRTGTQKGRWIWLGEEPEPAGTVTMDWSCVSPCCFWPGWCGCPPEVNALCTELNTNTPGPGAGEAKGGSRGRWERRQVWLLVCATEMSQQISDKNVRAAEWLQLHFCSASPPCISLWPALTAEGVLGRVVQFRQADGS